MTTQARIYSIRKQMGLSQKQFADNLGVNQSVISRAENPKHHVTDSLLNLICKVYGVNESYILNGEGDMFIYDQNYERLVKGYMALDPTMREFIILCLEALLLRTQ